MINSNLPDTFQDLNHISECQYYLPSELNNVEVNELDLSFLHLNARSLSCNIDKIHSLLNSLNHSFSIICVSESWLHSDSPSQLLELHGYKMLRADRETARGGGVVMYVKKDISHRVLDNATFSSEFQSIFIEIENSTYQKNIVVGVTYRPPSSHISDFIDYLDSYLNSFMRGGKHVYLLGDFNIDLHSINNRQSSIFSNFLQTYALYPLIDKPTRVCATSQTLLDNIFTNAIFDKFQSGILYSDISDHMPIFSVHKNRKSITSPRNNECNYFRKHTPDEIKKFNTALCQEKWSDVYGEQKDVDKAYNLFLDKLINYYNEHVPLRRKRNSRRNKIRKPWITKGILKSIHRKNVLFKQYIHNPQDTLLHEKFKKYRNKLNKLIKHARKLYYSEKLQATSGNTSLTWEILNEILGKTKSREFPEELHFNNIKTKDPKEIVNILNNYFVNIGTNLSKSTGSSNSSFLDTLFSRCKATMFFRPVSTSEILSIVKNLKNSKSNGHDGLNTFILKKIIYNIVDPLCHIFNMSLVTGRYPQSFKLARVIPVFKKGDPNQCNNYRPISILPCISKILERIAYDQLYTFLSKHNIILPSQYGFRKNHSTDLAILDIHDKITTAIAKKQFIVGVLLDLSKAFDTLDHTILLHKLEHNGVRGTPLAWFSDYLSNRQQYTESEHYKSDILNLQCGVPQGSILGPLLFLIYINDVTHVSPNLSYILFADDTTLLYADDNLDRIFTVYNTELPKLINWLRSNKLSINISKTNYIVFHSKKKKLVNKANHKIVIDNKIIEKKSYVKFLGIFLDEHLTWNQQSNHVHSNISRILGIMYKLKDSLPLNALLLLYKSFILSHLLYGVIAWGNCYSKYLDPLLKLQKKAVRLCTGSHYLAHTEPIFKHLRLLKLDDLNVLQTAIFMFKLKQNLLPPYFNSMFTYNWQIHSHNTRNREDFYITNPRTSLSSTSIRYKGPDVWHTLSDNIKQCSYLSAFKRKLKNKILGSYKSN